MTRNDLLKKFDRSPHALRMTPSIVVGVDDSAASREALHWAAGQSRLTGLPLRVVHAWQHSDALGATSAGITGYAEAFAADARARMTRLILDTLGDDAVDVRWTLEIVDGAAGPVLVARSRRARALVLGTGEHTGLHRVVPGSVSHYCLSHAVSPVVAVPAVKVSLATVGASSGSSLPM
jgi:nucleotide-binding universal stress UspA family protein